MTVAQLLVHVRVLQGLDGRLVDLLQFLQGALDNGLHVLVGSFGLKPNLILKLVFWVQFMKSIDKTKFAKLIFDMS